MLGDNIQDLFVQWFYAIQLTIMWRTSLLESVDGLLRHESKEIRMFSCQTDVQQSANHDLAHESFSHSCELHDRELLDSELPDGELPDSELQDSELPDSELPDSELPYSELPDSELPDHELPDSELLDSKQTLSKVWFLIKFFTMLSPWFLQVT